MKTSITALYEFFDHAERRNLLPSGTVQGRRAAAKAVFSALEGDNEQTVEYVIENLDSVLHRFTIKNRATVKGQTIETYKSRLRSALQDFQQWSVDPSGWERAVLARSKAKTSGDSDDASKAKKASKPTSVAAPATAEPAMANASLRGGHVVTLPIRMGQFSVSATLPTDGLTLVELKKLSNWLSLFLKEGETLSLPRTGSDAGIGL